MDPYQRRNLFFSQFNAEVSVPYSVLNPYVMNRSDKEHLPHAVGALPVKVLSSRMHNGNEAFLSTQEESGTFLVRLIQRVETLTVQPSEDHSILDMASELNVYGRFSHHDPSGYEQVHFPHDLKMNEDGHVVYELAKLTIPEYPQEAAQLLGSISLVHTMPIMR